jgi:carboxynorspermidine decarboxylase
MFKIVDFLNEIPNPCYVLEEAKFIKNMETFSFIEKASGGKVLCALKGFSMWSVFPEMKKYITGGTASSLHEAKLIFEEMGTKAHCCFVVYNESEFNELQTISSHITFNSLGQFDKFKDSLKKDIKYGIRINPESSDVEFEKYNPCVLGSRLGVTKKKLPNELPNGITGLHFHALCESGASDLEKVLEVVESDFGHLLHQAEWVNIGGGHLITKKGYNTELLIELISHLKQNYKVEVFLEPGEAIGWEVGCLLSKIEDIVENNGEFTAILNVSFAAHMPDCLEMPYKPKVLNETETGVEYTLGGNTCMSGDFVKGFHFENELKQNDPIIFKDMIHYTFVKTSFFNGVKHPSIGMITKEGPFKLLKSFNYEDFKYRLS